MNRFAMAISAGLIFSIGVCVAADDVTKPLQGVWRGKRFSDGKGEDLAKGVALELTITGNHVVGKRLPDGALGEGDIKIAADGKSIDALGTTGHFQGKTLAGIFKLEGDTLCWCLNSSGDEGTRPGSFEADASNDVWLMVLKKQ